MEKLELEGCVEEQLQSLQSFLNFVKRTQPTDTDFKIYIWWGEYPFAYVVFYRYDVPVEVVEIEPYGGIYHYTPTSTPKFFKDALERVKELPEASIKDLEDFCKAYDITQAVGKKIVDVILKRKIRRSYNLRKKEDVEELRKLASWLP
ncbi:MAG: hypothetical protein ACTSXC_08185 [Candidatus Freyarchaeota archaeon]